MKENKSDKESSSRDENIEEIRTKNPDEALELDDTEGGTADDKKDNPESLLIIEEITELLSNDDIASAVNKFKADSEEKEIAVEFANSHIQFLNQIVENDYKKGVERTDVEIRDIVSHVNMLLKKKDEYLFTTVVVHSPSHYRNMHKKIYLGDKKKEGEKAAAE